MKFNLSALYRLCEVSAIHAETVSSLTHQFLIRAWEKITRKAGGSAAKPSPKYGLIFVGGCPRSGTTALQMFLGSHPAIATGRETHLVDFYVGPFLRQYINEAQLTKCDDGIRRFVDESDVRRWCQTFSGAVFETMLSLKPGAAIVLEKTPDNAIFGCEIAELFPSACFISVIRDPRGVAASLFAASRESWGTWAPDSAAGAAKMWLRAIKTLPALDRAFGNRHIYVRYEDFLNPHLGARSRLVDFLATHFPEHAFKLAQFVLPGVGSAGDLGISDQRHNPSMEQRNNFFRKGIADGWQTELTSADAKAIERLCGLEMPKFGYSLE